MWSWLNPYTLALKLPSWSNKWWLLMPGGTCMALHHKRRLNKSFISKGQIGYKGSHLYFISLLCSFYATVSAVKFLFHRLTDRKVIRVKEAIKMMSQVPTRDLKWEFWVLPTVQLAMPERADLPYEATFHVSWQGSQFFSFSSPNRSFVCLPLTSFFHNPALK